MACGISIVKALIDKERITLDTILCDASNFFTYIDSGNERCRIAQRGHNKQKRMDLRQFGLLLLVTRKDQIPIFHNIYQGNLSDKTIFKEQFKEILNRFRDMSGSLEDILEQKFKATTPNQVWATAITYIPTEEGWLYLAGHKDILLIKFVIVCGFVNLCSVYYI